MDAAQLPARMIARKRTVLAISRFVIALILVITFAVPVAGTPSLQDTIVCPLKDGLTARMRSGPGPNYPLVDKLDAKSVAVNGRNQAATWVRIQWSGTVGWIETRQLNCNTSRPLTDILAVPSHIPPPSLPKKTTEEPPKYVAAARSASAAVGFQWATEYDVDRRGEDLRWFALAAPMPELCENACANDSACWAYTYAEPGIFTDWAFCWLKKTAPAAAAKAGYISGVKGKGGLEDEWDRQGEDLPSRGAGSEDECVQRCRDNARCWAATYDKNTHICWEKSAAPALTAKKDVVSYVKTLAPWDEKTEVTWSAVHTCSGDVLYREDLNWGSADGWSLESGWRIGQVQNQRKVLVGRELSWARYDQTKWGDAIFSAHVLLKGGGIHLNYRTAPGPARYYVGLTRGELYLKKEVNGQHPLLARAAIPNPINNWHQVQIAGKGGHIEVFLDGVRMLDYNDPSRCGPGASPSRRWKAAPPTWTMCRFARDRAGIPGSENERHAGLVSDPTAGRAGL